MKFIGLDFGARKAGTTAVCLWLGTEWGFYQSEKNKDADVFLTNLMETFQVQYVFIDAPLSLPAAYFQRGTDFHYRQADRELQAMSPMFLGGLTARAISMQHQNPQIQFVETYPAGLVRQLSLQTHYKKNNGAFLNELSTYLPCSNARPQTQHQTDALLAWLTGYRYFNNKAVVHGNASEGVIYT